MSSSSDPHLNPTPRLDEISTVNAYFDGKGAAIVVRYGPAIRRFLAGWLHNAGWANVDELADEVSQEVTLKLLQKPFAVNPARRGRFRDYLKRAAINQAHDFLRKRKADLRNWEADQEWLESQAAEESWHDEYRQVFLDRIAALAAEVVGGFPHLALRLLAEDREDEAADTLKMVAKPEPRGTPPTPEAIRQQLRRARLKIAPIVVEEVRDSLEHPTPDKIQAELAELGL